MPPTNLLMAKGLAATGVQPLLLKARRPGQPQAELQFMPCKIGFPTNIILNWTHLYWMTHFEKHSLFNESQ
jgi:hypothetical protein